MKTIPSTSVDDCINLCTGFPIKTGKGKQRTITPYGAPMVRLFAILACSFSIAFQPACAAAEGLDTASSWPLLVPQTYHDVTSASLLDDPNLVVTGGQDFAARLWHLPSGRLLRVFRASQSHIYGGLTCVAISSGDSLIAGGTSDGRVILWDVRTGNRIAERQILEPIGFDTNSQVSTVQFFTKDSAHCLFVTCGNAVQQFTDRLEPVCESMSISENGVWCAACTQDGSRAVMGDNTGNIYELTFAESLSVRALRQPAITPGISNIPAAVAISSASNKAIVGSWDGIARIYDLSHGTLVCELQHPASGWVEGVSISPSGERAITGGGGSVVLWDVSSKQALETRFTNGRCRFLDQSKDGKQVLAGMQVLNVWQANDLNQVGLLDAGLDGKTDAISGHRICSLEFSDDLSTFVSGHGDRAARVWKITENTPMLTLGKHFDYVSAAAFSSDQSSVITGSADYSVRIWSLPKGELTGTLHGLKSAVETLSISENCKRVLGASANEVGVWNLASSEMLFQREASLKSISCACLMPDGAKLLLGIGNENVKVLDVLSGNLLHTLPVNGFAVRSRGINHDGSRIAVHGPQASTLEVLELPSGLVEKRLDGFGEPLRDWCFSRNGAEVHALTDLGVYTWDIATGGRSFLNMPISRSFFSKISRDGRYVIDSVDGGVLVNNVANAQCEIRLPELLLRRSKVESLGFFGSGSRMWTLAPLSIIRFWNGENASIRDERIDRDLPWPAQVQYSDDRTRRMELYERDDLAVNTFVRELSTGRILWQGRGIKYATLLSRDGNFVFTDDGLVNLLSGMVKSTPDKPMNFLDLSSDNSSLLMDQPAKEDALYGAQVLRVDQMENAVLLPHPAMVSVGCFSPDGTQIATGTGDISRLVCAVDGFGDNNVRLWNSLTGENLGIRKGHRESILALSFSPDGKKIASGGLDGEVRIWDVSNDEACVTLVGHAGAVNAIAWAPEQQRLLTGGDNGMSVLWDIESKRQLFQLIEYQGGWMVIAPDGRFQPSAIESIESAHWVFPDNPFEALAPEIFMRDYFEPRLLSRLMSNEKLPPVRALNSLNRVQPLVNIEPRMDQSKDLEINVTVVVSSQSGQFGKDALKHVVQSGIFDLRLFRDGQLVGQWPEPAVGQDAEFEPDPTSEADMLRWRDLNRVQADNTRVTASPDGKMSIKFPVRLPHRDVAGAVEFTAYAFNEDRVKSETARFTYDAPAKPLKPLKPRAYLIGMGVSTSQNPSWNLKFAANDARLTVEELSKSLPQYDVVPVLLTSEPEMAPPTATRENLRTILKLLGGNKVPQESKAAIPNADQLRLVTPDDLVLITFSGHGYTDVRGTLHLLPYDVGANWARFKEVLPHCISSGDLAAWMKDIDAGELILILDACHSAAAGAPPGFKPGPLGGRGLAQLAYDKGMRVLAASQANDVALECELIQHGLLTYSLIREGLQNNQAMHEAKLTMGGLMAYAAERVPSLYEGIINGSVTDIAKREVLPIQPENVERSKAQTPELFDYAKTTLELSSH